MTKTEDFFENYIRIENILREGWVRRKIPVSRIESVSEHTLQVCMLASLYTHELGLEDIDIGKLLEMSIIHDLGEAVIGDIPVIDPAHNSKREIEEKGVIEMLSVLPLKLQSYYMKLWLEFENKQSKEALLAYQCDKLSAVLKAKHYETQTGREGLFKEFYEGKTTQKAFENGPLSEVFKDIGKRNSNILQLKQTKE